MDGPRLVGTARLDLDGVTIGSTLDQEVDLGSCGRTPEEELRMGMGQLLPSDEVFEGERFPACAGNRVGIEIRSGRDVEQVMQVLQRPTYSTMTVRLRSPADTQAFMTKARALRKKTSGYVLTDKAIFNAKNEGRP